jgi:hypothetical protein
MVAVCLFMTALSVQAQKEKEEDEKKGFKKENLFTGGSVTVSFFNRQTVLGANPYFGYKIANWLDAGLAFNYVYTGARDYSVYNDRVRQTVVGPGAFVRIYPVSIIFLQGQIEQNYSRLKYIYPGGSPTETIKADATSLLLGAGLAQGRQKGSNTFYYISLLFDVLKNKNSPYVDVSFDPNNPANQRIDIVPIIRAGINIGLFEHRYKREE